MELNLIRTSYKIQRKNKSTFFGKNEIKKIIKILLFLFFLILSTYRGTKAIKEDQAFSFVTHTFALTGEEDYLMFKPSARVLIAKSIFGIPFFAQFSAV